MNSQLTWANERRGWPLCRSYLLVLFDSVSVAPKTHDCVCPGWLSHWALGVLPGGDAEVLGAWTASQSDGPVWSQVFGELADRGVERIGFVVAAELGATEPALRDAYASAIVLASDTEEGALTPWVSARTPVASLAMSLGHFRKFMAAHESAQILQRSVRRAIGRHGPFSEPTDATAFVLDRLHRAEQKTEVLFVARSVAKQALAGPATRSRKGAGMGALSQ